MLLGEPEFQGCVVGEVVYLGEVSVTELIILGDDPRRVVYRHVYVTR